MTLLRKIFKFYLDASVHVALAVVSLYWVTVVNLNIPANYFVIFFLGCSTIVCYNFIKYGVEADKYLIVTKPYHKSIQIFSFVAFGFAVFFFVQLPSELWLLLFLLTLFSGLYALPFLPSSRNLRSLGVLKIVLVALVWIGLTGVLPVLENGMSWDLEVVLLLLRHFFLVVILMLPFEIRDMYFDPPELRTLPQRYGVTRTKAIGYLLLLFYVGLVLMSDDFAMWPRAIVQLSVVLFLFLALYKATTSQDRYFAAFWVESIPIAMSFLYYLVSR
ncbi:MAG: hypothetical protein AAF634_04185 [Bacteroidota bacterium]